MNINILADGGDSNNVTKIIMICLLVLITLIFLAYLVVYFAKVKVKDNEVALVKKSKGNILEFTKGQYWIVPLFDTVLKKYHINDNKLEISLPLVEGEDPKDWHTLSLMLLFNVDNATLYYTESHKNKEKFEFDMNSYIKHQIADLGIKFISDNDRSIKEQFIGALNENLKAYGISVTDYLVKEIK